MAFFCIFAVFTLVLCRNPAIIMKRNQKLTNYQNLLMERKTMKQTKQFTLIELLVVIAIIAILATMLFPVIGNMKEKANQTKCKGNLKNLAIATSTYADDFGSLPLDAVNTGSARAEDHAKNLINIRVKTKANDASLYVCPSDGARVAAISDPEATHKETEVDKGDATVNKFKKYISYAYLTGENTQDAASGGSMGTVDNSSAIIADGYYGTGTEEATAANGWNHDEFGNWLRKDQGVQDKSDKKWYLKSGANKDCQFGCFSVKH